MDLEDGFSRLLDADPERAAGKYKDLLQRLTRFFEWRRCSASEDLAQEVLLRGLQRIQKGVTIESEPVRYFFGIARNVLLEARRKAGRDPDAVAVDEVLGPDALGQVETRICLRQVLTRLSREERRLLERYHFESRDALRTELGLTAEALRVKIHRLHRRVQDELRRDMVDTVK